MPPRSAPLPGPAPVTKNVMFGACGNGGGAGCCAVTLDVTPSASAVAIKIFILLISVASLWTFGFTNGRMLVPLRATPNPRESEHRAAGLHSAGIGNIAAFIRRGP